MILKIYLKNQRYNLILKKKEHLCSFCPAHRFLSFFLQFFNSIDVVSGLLTPTSFETPGLISGAALIFVRGKTKALSFRFIFNFLF